MVTIEKIKFWINNDWNVLIRGKHGVGKTSMIKQACEELEMTWGVNALYFSGSTLDPYIDFGGIPTKTKDSESGEEKLEFLYPKCFDNNVKVIVIDEYNRSHKKVRNATMELMQFKSINGKKIPNLKCVIAAVNPPDDSDLTYDVEDIDPAQEDRFYIHAEIPYVINREYFYKKYGEQKTIAAIEWWNNLSKDIKNKVSPRRLEYALDVYDGNGDMNDVLPFECNISALKSAISSLPAILELNSLIKTKNNKRIEMFLSDENNYFNVEKAIIKDSKKYGKIYGLIPEEKLSKVIFVNANFRKYCLENLFHVDRIRSVCENILEADMDEKVCKYIKWYISKNKEKTNKSSYVECIDEFDFLFNE